jgi:hypothetical protein
MFRWSSSPARPFLYVIKICRKERYVIEILETRKRTLGTPAATTYWFTITFLVESKHFSNDDATMTTTTTTNVSVSIKILVSNLVVAALVATYLTSGSKNGSTVGLKGARQLQPTTFDGRPPMLASSPIKPILGDFNNLPVGFTPGPNLPSFSPINPPGIGDFTNFPTKLPPGNFLNFNFTPNNFLDQVKFTPSKVPSVGDFLSNLNVTSLNVPSPYNFLDQVKFTLPSKVPSVGDFLSNLNVTSLNVPSQPISFLDNANFSASNIPSVGDFLSNLDFTKSNIFGPGGKNNLDSIISGSNPAFDASKLTIGKLPPGQGFIQFPSP